jgi:hypothetical protein
VGKNIVASVPVVAQTVIMSACYHFFVIPITTDVLVTTALVISTALLALLATGNAISCLFPHPIDAQKLTGSTVSGLQVIAGMLVVSLVLGLVALGPVAGRLLASPTVKFVVLGVELVVVAVVYAATLSPTERLFERRAEPIIDALTKTP